MGTAGETGPAWPFSMTLFLPKKRWQRKDKVQACRLAAGPKGLSHASLTFSVPSAESSP